MARRGHWRMVLVALVINVELAPGLYTKASSSRRLPYKTDIEVMDLL